MSIQHINTVKAAPKQHLLLTKNKGLPHYLFFSVCCFFVQTELRVMMEHVWFITVTHNSIGQHWYITCHPLPQTSKWRYCDIQELCHHCKEMATGVSPTPVHSPSVSQVHSLVVVVVVEWWREKGRPPPLFTHHTSTCIFQQPNQASGERNLEPYQPALHEVLTESGSFSLAIFELQLPKKTCVCDWAVLLTPSWLYSKILKSPICS